MKRKWMLFIGLLVILMITACSTDDNKGLNSKEEITFWFWGAPPEHQETMREVLVNKYNQSQDQYELVVEFRNSVDKDISVALSAGQGPDIVYGSGPSFVMPFADSNKLEPLDAYAEKYGWEERIIDSVYEMGKVNNELYSLANSLNTEGIFYNKKVLKDNNWEIPKTVEDLEKIMDEAITKGLYASVTGNKGWKPVNENYSSIFLTHFAGKNTVYDALTGSKKWTDPEIVSAIDKSAEWYKKGYLAGDDYMNLAFNESIQLLADERSPFFFGPTLVFQFVSNSFTEDIQENLAFMPFPTVGGSIDQPDYTLGVTATLSINANSKHKDAAAEILDMMMTNEFMNEMTKSWPGYWGVPLKDFQVDVENMPVLSKLYAESIYDMIDGVNNGNFGYYTGVFLPPSAQQVFIDIDSVWLEETTSQKLMDKVQNEFEKDMEKGLIPPIPMPAK
ncbi:extracellular solute-binding protein [Sporosarcina sp. Marseille-Q4063]|uniref:ABC transporter substrate-binding protein n=1 Tax=Sporosarcina sp. Marseille-Q4063 TaxID=2810514 RepID=UPI001BB0CDDD|nr:extracellular solute-binding protein [Sporosarcina sp. Marseille-Q4063]QUW23044.1 extracellular solute-binding protein [Sporosarcina sp. Marseille-Q4063]